MDYTEKYYKANYKSYIEETKKINLEDLYILFEKYVDKGSSILDLGCGCGRDSLYFLKRGYSVTAIDNCKKFVRYAKKAGIQAIYMDIENMHFNNIFDSIWASASLLHIKKERLNNVFKSCESILKDNGILFCSFKYGEFEGIRDERYYVDFTEKSINDSLNNTCLLVEEYCITKDYKNCNRNMWISFILRKSKNS